METIASRHLVEPWDFDEETGTSPYRGRLQNVEKSDTEKEQRMMVERIQSGYSAVNEERALRDDPPIRDPKNRPLWQSIEQRACEMNPKLRYMPMELDELVAKVYQKQGGELRDWPDLPIGPNASQARSQEMMSEQQDPGMMGGPMGPEMAQGGAGGGDDMGATMGLPPGMMQGPAAPSRPGPDNSPGGLQKAVRDAMRFEQRRRRPVYMGLVL
jgi:hypothetical protein